MIKKIKKIKTKSSVHIFEYFLEHVLIVSVVFSKQISSHQ